MDSSRQPVLQYSLIINSRRASSFVAVPHHVMVLFT